MTIKYIKDTYNLPIKRGCRVLFKLGKHWETGAVCSADHHIIIKPDNRQNHRVRFHPLDRDNLIYQCDYEHNLNEVLKGVIEIYEIYAGSEGFQPITAPEAYQQRLINQMKDIARDLIIKYCFIKNL